MAVKSSARDSPRRRGRPSVISRERVLTEALRIVDEQGLDRLTMRRLGGELGVDPMAVYHHVPDKAALFAERVEARASRFLQRAKQVFRFVDELEQVRAGNYDLRAQGLAAVRGENTIVAARVLAKLDGEQVKIG